LWVDGTFWFVTGERTRKGRNLARDPRCTIAVSMRESDLVLRAVNGCVSRDAQKLHQQLLS
jgi:hypothetical protein